VGSRFALNADGKVRAPSSRLSFADQRLVAKGLLPFLTTVCSTRFTVAAKAVDLLTGPAYFD
jgi:hypothetical protein